MPEQQSTDEAALLQGDADGFAAFYRLREDGVLGYFLRRISDPELAADLCAESFARALEGRADFDPARGAAGAWLFGIARNVLARSLERGRVEDSTRRRLGMERLVLDDEAIQRIGELDHDPATLALLDLPPEQRTAVTGRVLQDSSYDALAAELACSESVVRQRVSRGLRTLRTRLEADR
jgi:RNA polymerase sigma factor (sigma-70 family)